MSSVKLTLTAAGMHFRATKLIIRPQLRWYAQRRREEFSAGRNSRPLHTEGMLRGYLSMAAALGVISDVETRHFEKRLNRLVRAKVWRIPTKLLVAVPV